MKKLNQALLLLGTITLLSCQTKVKQANFQVIPLPQEVVLTEGKTFVTNNKTQILYSPGNELQQRNAEFLSEYLKASTGKTFPTAPFTTEENKSNCIILVLNEAIEQNEGYELYVNENSICIEGKTEAGVFYGIQTLRKSIPAVAQHADIEFPAVRIKDYPHFEYRGMHLDVARHFFSVEFVKKYIDILALHNINKFHWHLTDDQGWRVEIKKYPKLTEVGSIRSKTVIGLNTREYDDKEYSGFYTQEEIKEIIAYAAEQYITVIPEIDLPGHMLAALAAYPELGCTGGPYEVSPRWGIFDDVLCIGNEEAMVFLEEILDEVITLFPSELIHIGGDEAPRVRWKNCPKCQSRIKKEGLKADKKHTAEDRLQTYCMSRMEKRLNSKGRRIIGWDEILEGDVAPNATIMSWRGMEGGIEAAKLGHDVIMVPSSYLYFDYYQTDNTQDEPLAIGGLNTVEKVYNLEPIPSGLSETERKHILGVQANLWTEYISNTEQVEYMTLPRIAALAEIQWTDPEQKDYKNFIKRIPSLLNIYQHYGYNYAKHIYDLEVEYTPLSTPMGVKITLGTIDSAPIYYTLDGTDPTDQSVRYENPIIVTENAQFRAAAIHPEGKSKIISEEINFNKATGCAIALKLEPSDKYKFNGASTLVDGLKGNDSYATGRWLGFIGGDLEATIDLGEPTEISRVSTRAMVDMGAWIMGATGLKVAISDDNVNFREIASKDYPTDTDFGKKSIDTYEVTFDSVITRYVKVIAKRSLALPKGHIGEGKIAYMFVDEISIE